MKGIHGVPYHIIFSVIILIVLLLLSVGYVYNKANIPFEKLWEGGLETGVPTEPGQISNPGGYSDRDLPPAPHIFTSGSTWDFSEIACFIANVIYNDYEEYVDGGPHNLHSIDNIDYTKSAPFDKATGVYLLDVGLFKYSEHAVGSNPIQADETKMNASFCHLCAVNNTGQTSVWPTSVLPAGAINVQKFDEACINLQLRDKTPNGLDYFCRDNIVTTYGARKFGNQQVIYRFNKPDSWVSAYGAFCNNGLEKIRWFAEPTTDDTSRNPATSLWNFSSSMKSIESVSGLPQNGRQYIYGVFWNPNLKTYDVVLLVIPQNTFIPNTDWSIIWDIMKAKGSELQSNYRRIGLAHSYWQARVIADFTFKPNAPISVGQLITNISDNDLYGNAKGDLTKIGLHQCSGLSTCISGVQQHLDQCDSFANTEVQNFEKERIEIYMYATDGTGKTIKDPFDVLPSGKSYRVIIKNWWQYYWKQQGVWGGADCFDYYDRSVAIMQLNKCSDVGGACSPRGPCIRPNGVNCYTGDNFGCDATPGNCCCVPVS